jgi:transcriptional regulator with XRE-family HTH domain
MGDEDNTLRVYESTPLVVMGPIKSHVVKTIGERIRQAREARDLSQAQLALMASFKHQSAIGNLETRATGRGGRRITDIADALAVPVEWLLKGPDCDDADIPWKVPPGHSEPGRPIAAEPAAKWGTPIVQEAVDLLRQMSSAGQLEAIRYLRYLARQHAFPPSADGEQRGAVSPSASKAA